VQTSDKHALASLLAEMKVDFEPEHHIIGPAPDEITLHFVVASFSLIGPNIQLAAIGHPGEEWATMRGDGVIAFESNQVLRSPAGDLVRAIVAGVYDAGEDGYLDALEDVLVARVPAECAVRFSTTAIDYRWLNRRLFLGQGSRDFSRRTLGLRVFCLD
jgi:hypothetical protein